MNWVGYALFGVVAGLFIKRLVSSLIARRRLPEVLKAGAQIVDVRSPGEFASGHASGSRNIPLENIDAAAKDLDPARWIIVCCASGARSGMARLRLRRRGFSKVLNAGSWHNLP